jgi:hypothetical protein
MEPRSSFPPSLTSARTPNPPSAQRSTLDRTRVRELEHPYWQGQYNGTPEQEDARAEWLGALRAQARKLPDDAFFSHVTAAKLWGIPLPPHLENSPLTDLTRPSPHHAPEGAGVRGHTLVVHPTDVLPKRVVRLTSLARTWCDLAPLLSEEELLVAGDFLIWRRRPTLIRVSREALHTQVDRHPGRIGASKRSAVLPLLSDRADSAPESTLRYRFLRAGLPEMLVNTPVRDDSGRVIATPHLQFAAFRLAVEYHGHSWRANTDHWHLDGAVSPQLDIAGWRVTAATGLDLKNSSALIARIKTRLRQRGWTG